MKLLKAVSYWFKGLLTCRCYIATKMTHVNRRHLVSHAKRVCAIYRKAGIEPISPVIEERVQVRKGKLENLSKIRLHKKWQDDKQIITWRAHAVVMDGADLKSFGMEREYGLNRYWLWKPTISVMEKQGLTVADFEDDKIYTEHEAAAHYLSQKHGNVYKRAKWRLLMINRSLPKFMFAQLWQWIH